MNRMMLTTFIAAAAFTGVAFAQQTDYSKVEIKTTNLGHNTYMLEGSGGNITVAVGDDGIIMVDSEFAPLHDKIKAAIAAVSKQPVRYLINTHYHGDHTGGDAAFIKEGVTVVAHENLRKRLEEGVTNALTGAKTPPSPPDALPTKTYTDKTTVEVKGRTAQVTHFPNAHTDGDSYVYFADANVLATGDIVSTFPDRSRFANMDIAVGGGIDGIIAGAETYLKMVNDTTKIVPGHGPLMNKADLVKYRDFMVMARERVTKLRAAGKSEDEAVAANPFADSGDNAMGNANFVRLIYRSAKKT